MRFLELADGLFERSSDTTGTLLGVFERAVADLGPAARRTPSRSPARPAAEHLRSCERLAAEIDAWQGLQSHATFVGSLRESFGRCWTFWQLLER